MRALVDTRLDILATDHAPHLPEEKARPYTQCPSGIPLIQFALQSALEHVFDGKLTLERLVETTAHAPATLFAIKDRGFLREGYFADLALLDPAKPHAVRRNEILSKCGLVALRRRHLPQQHRRDLRQRAIGRARRKAY